MSDKKKQIFDVIWEQLEQEDRNVVVVEHIKTLAAWDLKRVLCAAFDIDYIDDGALEKKFHEIVWTR